MPNDHCNVKQSRGKRTNNTPLYKLYYCCESIIFLFLGKTLLMDLLFCSNIEDKEVLFKRIENTESVRDDIENSALSTHCDESNKQQGDL